jgi:hypothetical protein
MATGERAAVISHLRTAIGEMVREALDERGFSLPLQLNMVGLNGDAIIVRYAAGDEALESRVVAEHMEHGSLDYPITLTLADQGGQSMFVEYQPEGEPSLMRSN